jgi:hypothetical protein
VFNSKLPSNPARIRGESKSLNVYRGFFHAAGFRPVDGIPVAKVRAKRTGSVG